MEVAKNRPPSPLQKGEELVQFKRLPTFEFCARSAIIFDALHPFRVDFFNRPGYSIVVQLPVKKLRNKVLESL